MIHCLTIKRISPSAAIVDCSYDESSKFSRLNDLRESSFEKFILSTINFENDIIRDIFNTNDPQDYFNIITINNINEKLVKIWFST